MKKILVATDGSPFALKAYEKACEEAASEPDSTICLLAVVPLPASIMMSKNADASQLPDELRAQLEAAALGWLEVTLKHQDEVSVPVETRMVIGNPGVVICEIAIKEAFDLVFLGSRGEGKVRRQAIDNSLSPKGQQRLMLGNLIRMTQACYEQHTGEKAGEAYNRRSTREIMMALKGLRDGNRPNKDDAMDEHPEFRGSTSYKEETLVRVQAIFLEPPAPPEGYEPLSMVS